MSVRTIFSHLSDGREFIAKKIDEELHDLVIDHHSNQYPRPETILWCKAQRKIKGTGGQLVFLPNGSVGFLRNTKTIPEGDLVLAQVSAYPRMGKMTPLQQKIELKGKYIIFVEGREGIYFSREIRGNEHGNEIINQINKQLPRNAIPKNYGVLIRSYNLFSSNGLVDEFQSFLEIIKQFEKKPNLKTPQIKHLGPDLFHLASRDWLDQEGKKIEVINPLENHDEHDEILELIHESIQPTKTLPSGGTLIFEQTEAMGFVDINTSGIVHNKGIRIVSTEASKILFKELRVRGMSGKIVIDYPAMNKQSKKQIGELVQNAKKLDKVPTIIHGWTKMGNFELERKRDRVVALGSIS